VSRSKLPEKFVTVPQDSGATILGMSGTDDWGADPQRAVRLAKGWM
jgi:hypothetical protein